MKRFWQLPFLLFVLPLVAILLLAFFAPVQPAYACTQPPGGLQPHTVAERVAAADVVLEGTVTAKNQELYPIVATITVHQYIKGSGPETVTISNFGDSSICLSYVSVGDQRLFYATGDPATGLRAFYLSQFDAVAPADPQTIGEAMAAAGQEPFIPGQAEVESGPSPLSTGTAEAAGGTVEQTGPRLGTLEVVFIVSTCLFLLVIVAGAAAVLFRQLRKGGC